MKQHNTKFGTFDCNLTLLRKNLRKVKTNGWTRSCVIFRNLLDSDHITYTNRGYYVSHMHGTGTIVDKICYLLDFGSYDRAVLFSVQQDLRLRHLDDVCSFLGALDVYLTSYGKMSSAISAGWKGIKGQVIVPGVDVSRFDKTLPDFALELIDACLSDNEGSAQYLLNHKSSGLPSGHRR